MAKYTVYVSNTKHMFPKDALPNSPNPEMIGEISLSECNLPENSLTWNLV